MAAKRRSEVDYVQLNSLSSVVLYDTTKRSRGRLWPTERIIERRRTKHDYEYLIKWQGWPYESCTWEPSHHLNQELLKSYQSPPRPSVRDLEDTARVFECSVMSALKSKSVLSFHIDNFSLTLWRYIVRGKGKPCGDAGCHLFQKEDFSRFSTLSKNWWYYFDHHGEGVAVDFPLKIKPLLSWSPKHHVIHQKGVIEATRLPVEKLQVTIVRRPCNIDNLFQ